MEMLRDVDQEHTHTAFDQICPSYIAEQHVLRITTVQKTSFSWTEN